MSHAVALAFGPLLKHLRKQAGMTQRDLAAALGYSESLISALEKAQRQPDMQAITERFIPALGLQDDPRTAAALIEQAALARGERPPTSITFQRTAQTRIEEDLTATGRQLPSPPTDLIGRAAEISQLCNRLRGHSGRLLTLVGPPGIGKTTLALAVAMQVHPHYQDGAVFVPLATTRDPSLVADALATTLKVPDSASKPPHTRLIEHMRRKEMLLVLDNFEQLISPPLAGEGQGVGLLVDLLAACAGLRILVTSRERLHLRAEQRYRVPPLALDAAVELFTQRAAAVNPDFVFTAANRPLIEAICQRLDRLPLALELCAAQIDLLSPSQLLAALQRGRLNLLVGGAQDLPPQQRTLRTAIGWSYSLLNDEERTLFRRLGVFRGGFALPEVAAVMAVSMANDDGRLADDIVSQKSFVPHLSVQRWDKTFLDSYMIPPTLIATLHALVGKSLVQVETLPTGEQRFLLLETLREFALEQLHTHGEEADLCQRHYRAYLHLFRTGDRHLRGAEATTWFARLELEQDNLRAALQWTLDAARYEDMAWLLQIVSYFWVINGHRYENGRWIARLRPYCQTLAVELRMALLTEFFVAARGSGEFPDLDQVRAEIIELMAVCPSKQLQLVAWYFLAESHEEQARTITLAREASAAPTLGPEFGALADTDFVLAANQAGYAGSLLHQGKVAEAIALVRDSLQRFRKRGNQEFIAECLGILADFALLRGDIDEAYAYVQEAIAIGTTHNLRIVHAEWRWLLGRITLYRGDAKEARRLLEENLPLCREIKNTFYLAQVCIGLAETALWEGDLEQAAEWLEQSFVYHSSPQRIKAAELQQLWIAARLATAQGAYRRAAILFGLAEAIHRQIHYIYRGPMLQLVNDALATVQAALEPALFAEAFAAGQQMALEDAFATILAPSSLASA